MRTLIVGLGNPGPRYSHTRHNIGFMVCDHLAFDYQFSFQEKRKWQGSLAEGQGPFMEPWMLLKPSTYMNESGRSVGKVMGYFQLEPANLIVIQDDLDLPFGTVRVRSQGSDGGHRGIQSIQEVLGTPDFKRVRIGIHNDIRESMRERDDGGTRDFVLMPFSPEEEGKLPELSALAVRAVRELVENPTNQTYKLPVEQVEPEEPNETEHSL